MAQITVVKQSKNPQPEQFKPYSFKKGQSGNPAGRPKGMRHKFSNAFCQDMLEDWEKHGMDVVRKVREDDPSTYLRVASGLIPREFKFTQEESTFDRIIEDMSNGEISELINGLRALGTAEEARERARQETAPGELNKVH